MNTAAKRLRNMLAWLALWVPAALVNAQSSGTDPWALVLNGPIGPASSDLVQRTLTRAEAAEVPFLVLQVDTPGGLDQSMRAMIQAIINAPLPVISYVYPSGARAASAGTYLLYASHVAAMAPATNLGAATPVQLGGGSPATPETPKSEQDAPADNATAMRRKVVNDAVAYIRSLAELRGRNADWAERAVREGASLSAREALDAGVIDLMADDPEQLLSKLDGRSVQVQNQTRVLATQGLGLKTVEGGWRHRFLQTITNPNIAYVLMLVGLYGLLLEAYNPGMGFPGIVGGICLLIALYAFQMLPVSYTGLALIGLGVALLALEVMSPSFGLFGIGGTVAFVIGSIMLMDTELPGYRIALPLIAAFTLVTVLMVLVVLALVMKARNARLVSGPDTLLGQAARVLDDFQGRGKVQLQGETWNAHCKSSLRRGDEVTVTGIRGLVLEVEKEKNHER
ncbi:nodulation protein NfeD [Motiliproteus sp. SC1-56]|uniref:NfeD family protein n=1 Tax=Motiliproteus sp. SC1-56 TaxID=2799565 RepID=UPI001A8C0CC3|nr:nodulation protein NfeD [Motiliproteus sp. SC1-56]